MNRDRERQQSAKITAGELVARFNDPVALAAEVHDLRTSTLYRLLAFLESDRGAETLAAFRALRLVITDELDSREPWPPTH